MKAALLHVSFAFALCVALANTSLFDSVALDLTYEHYAERRVEYLPAFLAMPCNCLVNVAYVFAGLYWLRWDGGGAEAEQSRYMRHVFAFMAVFYAPVQWARLAALRRTPAVLDQWFTLPMFAWVLVWISSVERAPAKWGASRAAVLELCSLLSYGLALVHERGFEVALACHVALAVYKGVRVHLAHGDAVTRGYLAMAMLSCAGFVALKLLDHRLALCPHFQRFTGHFWSKVCDVLQFHYSCCFLTALTQKVRGKTAAQQE